MKFTAFVVVFTLKFHTISWVKINLSWMHTRRSGGRFTFFILGLDETFWDWLKQHMQRERPNICIASGQNSIHTD